MCRMKELKGLMTFSKLSHPNIMKVGVTRWPVVDVHYERIVWKGHIRHLEAGERSLQTREWAMPMVPIFEA